MGRRILYLRDLLAGVGVDDSAWFHSQRLNQLNLSLKGDNVNSQKKGGILNKSWQSNFSSSTKGALYCKHLVLRKFLKAHLACTVEAGSQGCQCHNNGPAVVAFDGIEGSNARQVPCPAQMFL